MGKARNKSSSLKATLQSQQTRLQEKYKIGKAAHAADKSGRNSNISKRRAKTQRNQESQRRRVTVPFLSTDHILLIGEGNFSFSRALICNPPPELEFLPPKNVTATAYDTEDECYSKYPEARAIVLDLKENGMEVLFGVDATKLEKVSALRGRRWNHIVWNFPHAGKGITDQDRNILSNQMMIIGFLRSAACFLSLGPVPSVFASSKRRRGSSKEEENDGTDNDDTVEKVTPGIGIGSFDEESSTRGTVLITLRNVPPYTLWDVPRLAKNPSPSTSKPNPPYALLRSFKFCRSAWSGYEHRMTKGERAHGEGKPGEGGEDRTWEFYLRS